MRKRVRDCELETKSAEETRQLGARLAPLLNSGDVVLLVAHLGAGKTTFIQGVAEALGVRDRALSPTFIIAQTLKGRKRIHHLDFYRLNPREILGIGIQDYLVGGGEVKKGIVLIEWADRCPQIWPPERLEIHLKVGARKARKIRFVGSGRKYERIVGKLARWFPVAA